MPRGSKCAPTAPLTALPQRPPTAPSRCETVTGPGFSSPNRPDQERTTAYRDSSGPISRSAAHCATILGDRQEPTGDSRFSSFGIAAVVATLCFEYRAAHRAALGRDLPEADALSLHGRSNISACNLESSFAKFFENTTVTRRLVGTAMRAHAGKRRGASGATAGSRAGEAAVGNLWSSLPRPIFPEQQDQNPGPVTIPTLRAKMPVRVAGCAAVRATPNSPTPSARGRSAPKARPSANDLRDRPTGADDLAAFQCSYRWGDHD